MNSVILSNIAIAPAMCFGKATIRKTRYSVEMDLDLLSSGITFDEIIDDYPALNKEDIQACVIYNF